MIVIVGSTKFDIHQIQSAEGGHHENQFHCCIIETNVSCE